jgi:hypothetical protein
MRQITDDFACKITITKLDHAGRPVLSYPGEVAYRDEELTVARCRWTDSGTLDLDGLCLRPGDIFMEFYFAKERFNIFQICDLAGRFKGWYCNVTELAEITEGEIRWRDLILDLVVLPDGRQIVRDQEEFEALDPSADLRARVDAALETLQRWAQEGRYPFYSVDASDGLR